MSTKSDLRSEIGAEIFAKCPKGDAARAAFLHTQGGYDAIFQVMNSTVTKHLKKGADGKPVDLYDKKFQYDGHVIDIHTHVCGSDREVDRNTYLEMGGEWWFAPERFDILNAGRDAQLKKTIDRLESFRLNSYRKEMFQRGGQTKQAVVTPAPGNVTKAPTNDPLPPWWIMSIKDINECCRAINKDIGLGTSYPAGRIIIKDSDQGLGTRYAIDPNLDKVPKGSDPRPQDMGYWKIYSGLGGRWISGGTDLQWLTERAAAGAFEAIAQREDISKVICIHWSSSHDDLLVSRNQQHTPIDEDRHKDHAPIEALEPLLQKNQERNWKLKFVILHGAYPQHRRLAAMTNRYPDQLFIEIGAIFAGLVVLFHEPEGVRRFVEQLRTEANPRSVLWGTDAIWYGSPQWQIEAFKRLNLEGDAANASAFKLNVLRSNAARLLPL